MKRTARKENLLSALEAIPVVLIPIPVPTEEFAKKKDAVQDILASMVLAARKNGRPKKEGLKYEEAA